MSREEFLTLGTTDILDFVLGGHLVHYGMCRSIHGLYPLDASNTSPSVVTIKNISRHCKITLC